MNRHPERLPGGRWGFRVPALVLSGMLLCAGCNPSKPAPAQEQTTGPASAEVAKVEKTFASADASLKFPVQETLRVVKAGGYADALPNLRKLAGNAKATPEQQQVLQDLVQKLEALPGAAVPP